MSWYEDYGPSKQTVVSTRVRLARNLSKYKFMSKMSAKDSAALVDEVIDVFISSNKSFKDDFTLYRLSEMSAPEKLALVEKHLISHELAGKKTPCAAIVKKDETVSIMIGEEDHLRIQVILPGLRTKEALEIASMYDTLLGGRLEYSHSDRFGYLTACPTNVGTGLRVSAMLHLPALTISKSIGELLNAVGKLGMTIRGMHGEGTSAGGGFYQLSNQITLGVTYEETEKKFLSVLSQIQQLENNVKKQLLSNNEVSVNNRVMRAYGTLVNSYAITSKEMISLLSDVRFGAELDILPLKFEDIDKLLVTTSAGVMITDHNLTEPIERDKFRAQISKQL